MTPSQWANVELEWLIGKMVLEQIRHSYVDIWCPCFNPCECAFKDLSAGLRPALLSFCPSIAILEELRKINATGSATVQIKCIDCYKPMCCNAANMPDSL